MMVRSNTLEQGVDGNDVTTLDAGSPDSFNAISAVPPKYTNVQKHSGALSMRWVTQIGPQFCQYTPLGGITTDGWMRAYMFMPALPSDNNFYPLAFRTAADASCAILRILTTGVVQGRTADNSNAFAEGTVACATNQWIRLEWRVLPSVTAGTMEWRLYNSADSSSPSDSASATGLVLGADLGSASYGLHTATVAAGMTVYYDDVDYSDVGWIGPTGAGAAPVFTRARRSRSGAW